MNITEINNDSQGLLILSVEEAKHISGGGAEEEILTPSTVKGQSIPPVEEPPDPFAVC